MSLRSRASTSRSSECAGCSGCASPVASRLPMALPWVVLHFEVRPGDRGPAAWQSERKHTAAPILAGNTELTAKASSDPTRQVEPDAEAGRFTGHVRSSIELGKN